MKAIIAITGLILFAAELTAQTPSGNRVVVLDNENLLEGEISTHEEGWKIRRPDGGELVIPPKRILTIVADRPAAFDFISKRANLRDADERLRLARWCHRNNLPEEARRQASAAISMRPGFKPAIKLLASLEPTPSVIQAKAETPKTEAVNRVNSVDSIDYNSASFPMFATRVHAILLNTCANCHAKEDVKAFRLVRQTGRPAVSRNLMSALSYIDQANPAKSSLLLKAVTPHGNATEPPLKTRNHPAYQALEQWALIARALEGTTEPNESIEPMEPKRLPLVITEKESPLKPNTGTSFGAEKSLVPKTKSEDPFDPDEFNKNTPMKP